MLPDPERGPAEAATKARAISQAVFTNSEYATEPSKLQARRISRIYAVSYATAVAVAELAYAVAP
jgi:hypothetical protein